MLFRAVQRAIPLSERGFKTPEFPKRGAGLLGLLGAAENSSFTPWASLEPSLYASSRPDSTSESERAWASHQFSAYRPDNSQALALTLPNLSALSQLRSSNKFLICGASGFPNFRGDPCDRQRQLTSTNLNMTSQLSWTLALFLQVNLWLWHKDTEPQKLRERCVCVWRSCRMASELLCNFAMILCRTSKTTCPRAVGACPNFPGQQDGP